MVGGCGGAGWTGVGDHERRHPQKTKRVRGRSNDRSVERATTVAVGDAGAGALVGIPATASADRGAIRPLGERIAGGIQEVPRQHRNQREDQTAKDDAVSAVRHAATVPWKLRIEWMIGIVAAVSPRP